MSHNGKGDTTRNPSSTSNYDQLRAIAAFLGATGVTLGAFGAHGLKNRMPTGSTKLESWKTAVMYQLMHAVTILSISAIGEYKQQQQSRSSTTSMSTRTGSSSSCPMIRAGQFMALGTILFSGSIYMLCLDVPPKKLFGPITPIGGLLIITGWTMLFGATAFP
jgi:uncharacterized membrane protein YgdD (TMEM256/DUF423 family)